MAEGMIDKKDNGKPPMDMLAVLEEPLAEVARVLDSGNGKYLCLDNFKTVTKGRARFIAAAIRHTFAALNGRFSDPETGRRALAHAACDLLMALWHELNADKTPACGNAWCQMKAHREHENPTPNEWWMPPRISP